MDWRGLLAGFDGVFREFEIVVHHPVEEFVFVLAGVVFRAVVGEGGVGVSGGGED